MQVAPGIESRLWRGRREPGKRPEFSSSVPAPATADLPELWSSCGQARLEQAREMSKSETVRSR